MPAESRSLTEAATIATLAIPGGDWVGAGIDLGDPLALTREVGA
jgi:hypothetical protein